MEIGKIFIILLHIDRKTFSNLFRLNRDEIIIDLIVFWNIDAMTVTYVVKKCKFHSAAPVTPELATRGDFRLSRLSISSYFKTIKKNLVFLPETILSTAKKAFFKFLEWSDLTHRFRQILRSRQVSPRSFGRLRVKILILIGGISLSWDLCMRNHIIFKIEF